MGSTEYRSEQLKPWNDYVDLQAGLGSCYSQTT